MARSHSDASLRLGDWDSSMNKGDFSFGPVILHAAPGWEREASATPPLTLVRSNGEGALQISTADFVKGKVPDPSATTLVEMSLQFGEKHNLGTPFSVAAEETAENEPTRRIGAASFRSEGDFIRAWNVSNGRDFAFLTYVCKWGNEVKELADCERMVRSLEFLSDASQPSS